MTSLCIFQNNWSNIFRNIFKNWNSFSIWDLLNIYNLLNTLNKIWEVLARWTLELWKTQFKYFVLDFPSNHELSVRNPHNQKILRNWISCFRVKLPNLYFLRISSVKNCAPNTSRPSGSNCWHSKKLVQLALLTLFKIGGDQKVPSP